MRSISKVSFTENVAIISFENAPSRIGFLSGLFDRLAQAGINVDMISQTAPKGRSNTISFTVADEDVAPVLSLVGKEEAVRPMVSAGNMKISLYGAEMTDRPGVAADVFDRLNAKGIDLLLITTSDVDISVVVSSANADMASRTLEEAYR